ncbi:MAG: NosD domain-containing protein, partial [Candidatus Hermodarchaeota archaeon]
NIISGNIADNNTNGIYLEFSYFNNISGNTARYNKLNYFNFGNGIHLTQSEKNNISENIFNNNVGGINTESSNNMYINNTVNNNSYFGIAVSQGGSNNHISRNIVKNNTVAGIGILDSDYNKIWENIVDSNGWIGIGLNVSNFNSIFENIISNHEVGIYINNSCHNDVINNTFVNNMVNYLNQNPRNDCYESDLKPEAFFTATPTIITLSDNLVQFQFRGFEGNSPTFFRWNFGDGSPSSTERNPTHRYTSPGTYTVILLLIDADGDIDGLKRVDYIKVLQDTLIPGFDLFFLLIILSLVTMIITKKLNKSNPQFGKSRKSFTNFLKLIGYWFNEGVQQFVQYVQNIVL